MVSVMTVLASLGEAGRRQVPPPVQIRVEEAAGRARLDEPAPPGAGTETRGMLCSAIRASLPARAVALRVSRTAAGGR